MRPARGPWGCVAWLLVLALIPAALFGLWVLALLILSAIGVGMGATCT